MWWFDPDPVRGHEQGRTRPAVVVSADVFNRGPHGLVVVCPLTRASRGVHLHVEVAPPEGGLSVRGFVLCDQVRTISTLRLQRRTGALGPESMAEIDLRLRIVLRL